LTHDAGASFPASAIRLILDASDPRLRVISTPVNTIDDGRRTLVADIGSTMSDAREVGLAV